jgi:cytoskeleton protein RodZ
MSENATVATMPAATLGVVASGAGSMIRQAREQQGMHIAMLAAMMKVTPKKLEALEDERLSELPDLAFARALAQSVCRVLKIDSEPVLARLPSIAKPEGLEHTATGLNAPFRETLRSHARGSLGDGDSRWQFVRAPMFWVIAAILAGALALAFAPSSWLPWRASPAADSSGMKVESIDAKSSQTTTVVAPVIAAGAVSAASTPAASVPVLPAASDVKAPVNAGFVGPTRDEPSSAIVVETLAGGPPAPATAAAATMGVLQATAKSEVWLGVVDVNGRSLIGRTLKPGETVTIDGATPFKVRVGNVSSATLKFRGEAVDLVSRAIGNVARFELK